MEQTTTEGPKRPQFLTVLCILTFIGVGVGIIGSIVGWWGMHVMSGMMDGTSNMPGMEDMDMSAFPGMEESMAQMKYMNITLGVGIVGSLICLIGALQMWKLKKMGFYIYVVGEIAPVIVSTVLMGATALAGFTLILGAIIPVVFIVLYALNLKHMS